MAAVIPVNLHQLEVFYAVAERLSMTEAACDLHLTQPAVSLQVRALEKELGLSLLERGGRKLRMTQAGEVLYHCAVSVIHAKEEAGRAIAELRQATKGKLILGSNTTGGMYLLPRIVRAFRDVHPGTEIVLLIESTVSLYEKILQNVVDMVLVGGPTDDRRFGVEPVCVDQLALIVSPAHPLARGGEVAVKELEKWPCIAPQQVSLTRQFVERKLRDAGVKPQIAMELPGTEAVKKAVEANLGFAIVSGFSVDDNNISDALRVIPLNGTDLRRNMELIYRRQKYFSPVAQRFREFIHNYAAKHLPEHRLRTARVRSAAR